MPVPALIPSESRLRDICRRYGVRRLSLFGSAQGSKFRVGSDVDLLVEFIPGSRLGLRYFTLEQELTDLVGHRVDLNTPAFLSPEIRNEVQAEAEVLYECES
jgi:uncharacterized protein